MCAWRPAFLLLLFTQLIRADPASPADVVKRVLSAAAQHPPGAVENDVSAQAVQSLRHGHDSPADDKAVSALLAADFDLGALDGALSTYWTDGAGDIETGPIHLKPAALQRLQQSAQRPQTLETPLGHSAPNPGELGFTWTDDGGYSSPLDRNLPNSGHALAYFCLARQHGAWKLHCVYLATAPPRDFRPFIARHLSALAQH
jgi:hypothetical protein